MSSSPVTSTLLPMWRSPTASSCSSSSRAAALSSAQLSWDDTEVKSPSRMVQCLNFLSQVERIHVRETRKRLRVPVYEIDVYLSADGLKLHAAESAPVPTYQIERTLAEFAQLRDQVALRTSRCNDEKCVCCSGFTTRRAAWEQHWPRPSVLRRLFHARKNHSGALPLKQMLDDVVALSRSRLRASDEDGREPCNALQQIPVQLTNFLVRQELYMDE